MGVSASSLLDEAKSSYIKGQAEAKLKEFSPYYRKQFSVARFAQVEDDLEQNKEKITQLLKQRDVPEDGEVLYQEGVLYFDDTRKWKERYVVVRANYCLECHESLETFLKGVPAFYQLLPTGGSVLTTEEMYMAMVDKCFPGDTSVKEEFVPPLSGMSGEFPVYLRLPYRRDSYFCFRQQAKQAAFLSILSDCIRHQNQDFLKKRTCDVQAFLKAIQLYRQDQGNYEAWDMLVGSDVRVMANLVMEQLLPSLESDILPRLKAKKTERKRVWFATMEAAYILVQEHLLEGLGALKEECRTSARQQEVQLHSDMDQILSSRRQLEEKVRAKVTQPAEQLCSESVQPYLGSVLEELMEPVSSGFLEGRQQSEKMMDQVCQDVLQGGDGEQLKKALANMARPNLLSCYQKIGLLQEKLQHLQERFGFINITGVIHSAQIDLQQLMENAAFTFELLLDKAMQDNPDNAGPAIEKVKHRVLKQYDYDSSTVRKRIFQDALVSITLPFIKRNLAPTCKTELQGLEQSIYPDHANFLHVENIYESILLQILDKEVSKVVKEAASLKKYNLFTDSRDLLSRSSRSSLSSPTVSTPSSPTLVSPAKTSLKSHPPSPLVVNGLPPSTAMEEQQEEEEEAMVQSEASTDVTLMETSLGKGGQKEDAGPDVDPEPPTVAEASSPTETHETRIQEELFSVQTKEAEMGAEPEEQNMDAEVPPAEPEPPTEDPEPCPSPTAEQSPNRTSEPSPDPTAGPSPECKTEPSPDPTAGPSPDPTGEPVSPPSEGSGSRAAGSTEDMRPYESSEVGLEAPSSGEEAEVLRLIQKAEQPEPVTTSDPNSLDVSVGSESAPSDLESSGEVSTTSDILEVVESSMSSDEAEEKTPGDSLPTPTQMEVLSADAGIVDDIEAGAGENLETSAESVHVMTSLSPVLANEETSPGPDVRPLDCIKEIRDLVVEVIEVEEVPQLYPKAPPNEE
ncbi:protein Niban 1a [Melanotaenia boesemani]|uniref:protein Niban 1a n=1 Tax=Melanotaenia boesemani TaxID=1250792 RepID=UPI001C05B5AE|nr:protein Niban 1a [Melanotaenia boesemani]